MDTSPSASWFMRWVMSSMGSAMMPLRIHRTPITAKTVAAIPPSTSQVSTRFSRASDSVVDSDDDKTAMTSPSSMPMPPWQVWQISALAPSVTPSTIGRE